MFDIVIFYREIIMATFYTNNSSVIIGNGITMINGKVIGGMIEGNGNIVTKEVPIKDIEIERLYYDIGGEITINIHPDFKGKESLTIQTDENIMEAINVSCDNILELSCKKSTSPSRPVKVVLDTSSINYIVATNTGDIEGTFTGAKLKVLLSGTGNLSLAGETDNLEVKASGTGQLFLKNLVSQNLELSLSGTSSGNCHASKSADIAISGVSNIELYGNPAKYSQHISGVGRITKTESSKFKP